MKPPRELGCNWIYKYLIAFVAINALLIAPLYALQDYDIDQISRAVVQVRVDEGTGSGTLFVRDSRVLILTNKHVVEGYYEADIAVLLDVNEPAEVRFKARLVGFSDEHDIALLEITHDHQNSMVSVADFTAGRYGLPFQALKFASSQSSKHGAARRGEHVGIFGYPGVVDNEMVYTTGIISSVQYGEYNSTRLPQWYRTNAEMSPGNSGGAAVNSRGELIGIPTFVANEQVTGSRLGSLFSAEFAMAVVTDEEALLTDWSEQTRSADESLDFNKEPYFGSSIATNENLYAGIRQRVTAGGLINARYLDDDCVGYAASAPDYRLQLNANTANLYISFSADEAAEDSTLVVRTADGKWHCNDDYQGLNPGVQLTNVRLGEVNIWVGSYAEGDYIAGELTISNQQLFPAGAASGEAISVAELELTGEPYSGEVHLAALFTPDPHRVSVSAGGSVNLATTNLTNCVGFVARRPDIRLHWSGSGADLQVYFQASNTGDAVLLINTPDGRWHCNDDANSSTLNPGLLFSNASSGVYDIWVGSYTSGEWISGNVNITEIPVTVP
ncbi:MAG: serine protease [Idiomarina sp.]|nr:serine protease [Idiomarina sp.]